MSSRTYKFTAEAVIEALLNLIEKTGNHTGMVRASTHIRSDNLNKVQPPPEGFEFAEGQAHDPSAMSGDLSVTIVVTDL